MDKLIVVTGAAGFIGSCVVRYLNDRGITRLVLVDDIKETNKDKNLRGKQFVSLISRHEIFQWLEGKEKEIGAFIHLGACSDTLETNRDYLLENNTRFSIRLAEYALKHGHRFICASSAATYGRGEKGFSDDHALLEELQPLNLYGISKHLFDLWAKKEGVLDQIVALKYFNVFGPNEGHKGRMASMVYKMLPSVMKEGVVRLFKSSEPDRFKDGEQTRDFLFVKDAVRMTCSFLENSHGGIFNIGMGERTTWNSLSQALFKAVGKSPQIEYIEMPAELKKQYQNDSCAEMGKYAKFYGLTPSQKPCHYSIESATEEYVRDYLLKDAQW